MSRIIKHNLGRATSGLWERQTIEGPGVNSRVSFRSIKVGTKSAELTVEVDLDRLLGAIGDRALKNKSGVTKLQSGAVIVRVVKGTVEETRDAVATAGGVS